MSRAWVLMAILAGGVAVADEANTAREHYIKGTRAFDLGAYDEAVTEYSAAYRAKDDPALLYNIAQAHRLAAHPAEALRFYKMFLVKVPKAVNRAEVEAKIAELQKLVDQQKKTQQNMQPDAVKPPTVEPRPEPPPSEPEPAPRAVERAVKAPVAVLPAPQAPPANVGRTKKIAGAVVAAVGVGALAAGIALSVMAKQYSDDLSNPSTPYDAGKEASGRTFNAAGPALLAVGGAALVAGVVVAVLGVRESRAVKVTASSLQVRF
jgi:hypothetical protein